MSWKDPQIFSMGLGVNATAEPVTFARSGRKFLPRIDNTFIKLIATNFYKYSNNHFRFYVNTHIFKFLEDMVSTC